MLQAAAKTFNYNNSRKDIKIWNVAMNPFVLCGGGGEPVGSCDSPIPLKYASFQRAFWRKEAKQDKFSVTTAPTILRNEKKNT